MKKLGECFNKCANRALEDEYNKEETLVHAIIIGQGKIMGVHHGHAWIEKNGVVIDLVNNVEMQKALYYSIAKPQVLKTYSYEEAVESMRETGHRGPWDSEILRINNLAIEEKND